MGPRATCSRHQRVRERWRRAGCEWRALSPRGKVRDCTVLCCAPTKSRCHTDRASALRVGVGATGGVGATWALRIMLAKGARAKTWRQKTLTCGKAHNHFGAVDA